MDSHDANRRRAFAGVTAADLGSDKQIWTEVGEAIAAVALRIVEGCDASAYSASRPAAEDVCARLAESVDDQIDVVAWSVIDAVARARVSS